MDKTQSAGAYFGDQDGAAVFSAMPWQAEHEVVMMTDGSVLAWPVAGTPVEPKPECWWPWRLRVEIEMGKFEGLQAVGRAR